MHKSWSFLTIRPYIRFRPFDLGDRIYMHEPSVWNSDNGLNCSWFVEGESIFENFFGPTLYLKFDS